MLFVNIIMLYVNINRSHVDLINLACRGQKYATHTYYCCPSCIWTWGWSTLTPRPRWRRRWGTPWSPAPWWCGPRALSKHFGISESVCGYQYMNRVAFLKVYEFLRFWIFLGDGEIKMWKEGYIAEACANIADKECGKTTDFLHNKENDTLSLSLSLSDTRYTPWSFCSLRLAPAIVYSCIPTL